MKRCWNLTDKKCADCGKHLSNDNRSGYCKEHYKRGKYVKRRPLIL